MEKEGREGENQNKEGTKGDDEDKKEEIQKEVKKGGGKEGR